MELYNEYFRNYWSTHPEQYEKQKERARKWQREHPSPTKFPRQYFLDWRVERKIRVLSHYSPHGIPECCNPFGEHKEPYTTLEALSIDHINNDGGRHKKEIKKNLYGWLIKNNFPDGFQTLCMNCQFIKKSKKLRTEKFISSTLIIEDTRQFGKS